MATTGKGPAILQGPDQRFIEFSQYLKGNKAAVYPLQVDDVGTKPTYLTCDFFWQPPYIELCVFFISVYL